MEEIKNVEQKIIFTLKKRFKLKIEEACFASGSIPKLIILDRTRNIHSYLIICKKDKNNLFSSQFLHGSNLEKNLIEITRIQYSALDRPLFLIYKNESDKSIKAIEVSEIKELFLQDKFSRINLFQLEIDFDKVSPLIKQEL
jgi:hypothetical protein